MKPITLLRATLVGVGLLAVPGLASTDFIAPPQFLTGTQLLLLLEEGGSGAALGRGYVMGATDGLTFVPPSRRWICLPGGVANEQVVRVVQKYLKENPETLHYLAQGQINNALVRAFPCKDKR